MVKLSAPALFLFFLSPVVAELMSGSAPPVRFFNPLWFFPLVLFYGTGANIIRELVRRWNKGIPTLLALGVVYGILEEGIALKTFFDPAWPMLGILGSYGRALGINWVWTLELPFGHAIFSIAIPIMLTGLLFPRERDEPWIDGRTFDLFSLVFAGEIILTSIFFETYPAPTVPYVITGLVAAGLAALSRRIPNPIFAQQKLSVTDIPSPLTFWLIGFFSATALVIIHFSLPHILPPLMTILVFFSFLAVDSLLIFRLSGMGGGAGWSDLHKFALMSGALSVLVAYAPVQEFVSRKALPVDTSGMTFFGAAFAVFLLWAWGRIRGFAKNPPVA